ncbi:unnamed protein product [Cuscuta epithymum]|uniref:Uncharacterized protein n=1 Tax=Cuscuta epithymum TaxID=186058 RepID=A0AAV0GIX8_9ASTE|nr:unnamed protein product [Cuscuta epithymum]
MTAGTTLNIVETDTNRGIRAQKRDKVGCEILKEKFFWYTLGYTLVYTLYNPQFLISPLPTFFSPLSHTLFSPLLSHLNHTVPLPPLFLLSFSSSSTSCSFFILSCFLPFSFSFSFFFPSLFEVLFTLIIFIIFITIFFFFFPSHFLHFIYTDTGLL